MSRGLGWVQTACLQWINKYEAAKELPTTYNIVAEVYQIERDKDGNRWVTDAQHVAVKRALEGLQRQGKVIGFRTTESDRAVVKRLGISHSTMTRARARLERPAELCHHWMSERRAQQWLRDKFASAHQLEHVRTKMRAIGMKVD